MIRNASAASNSCPPLNILHALSSASRHYSTRTTYKSSTPHVPRQSRPNPVFSSSSSAHARSRKPPLSEALADQAPDESSRLPRYMRRQALANAASDLSSRPSNKATAPKFRSKKYDPTHDETKANMRMLEPHVLSGRLKALCDAGKLEDAIVMLKNSPLDAQNTPVWNTMMWECMKAKRFNTAYLLFVDMKRRGFSPSTRTFQTMFTGLSRIEDWSTHTKQLVNARSLYEAFQRHLDAVKRHDSESEELAIKPLGAYIKLLGDAGKFQEMFDIYYAMDSDGPLSPDQYIFTAMFQALSSAAKSAGQRGLISTTKTAADAKLLWTQMLKASKKSPGFTVDSHLVTSAISALTHGRPADQEFALRIVEEYFGLSEKKEPYFTGTMPLQAQSLAATLRLCNQSSKPQLCIDFFQKVKRRPEAMGGVSIIDRAHVEEVLKAHLALPPAGAAYQALDVLEWMLRQEITGKNGPAIRPALSTYDLVFRACWYGVDWEVATRAFDLMTGYHSHDFMDGAVKAEPRFTKRGNGRNLSPRLECLSSMVKTAFTSKNRANMRQCLRIIDYLGIDNLLSVKRGSSDESNKSVKQKSFFASKLAAGVVETVEYVLLHDKGRQSPEEAKRWMTLASRCRETVARSPMAKEGESLIPVANT